ncbi:MAG: triphosphoribosyl-dephospho-CoA synthase [Rudaea sp.]|nr:triphosphoribosyl-dephospho-CoA synthase [Rudaea sp.]
MQPHVTQRLTAHEIADAAVWALREEALLTPKPALVDQRGNGAHPDMDLPMLLRSATALHSTFVRVADCAAGMPFGVAMREQLVAIGRAGEAHMLAATNAINTHRGAVWALGLLAAATAITDSAEFAQFDPAEICILAGFIAQLPAADTLQPSHGRTVFLRHGARGARGEAEDGFPHLRHIALPALRAARERFGDESLARLHTLITLMASVEDTCLLFRGGRSALAVARRGASCVLAAGVDTPLGGVELDRLDRRLLGMNASAGGCADLLAATLFLDRLMAIKGAIHGNA